MTNQRLRVVIGGDTVPTKSNEIYLKNGQEDSVFNGVKDVFSSADIAVVNLECPLTTYDKPIKKSGPCIKADPDSIDGLLNIGINVFSLANNHIMDYGPQGLEETLSLISDKNALSVGAGKNLESARKVLTIQKNGYKIALISAAEHEFSIAQEHYPGANPFDPFDTIDDIRNSKLEADLTIVLYHGGIEHYRYPSPSLQKLCRKMVENGADVVICQHSHCIGAHENYEGGHIIYGQGNLLFDYSNNPMWQEELLVQLTLEGEKLSVEFVPLVKRGFAIDVAEGEDRNNILASFQERSNNLSNKDLLEQEWLAFCETRKYFYLYTYLNFGYVLRKLDRVLGHALSNTLLKSEKFLVLYNVTICEAHASVQKTIFKQLYQKNWN